MATSVTNVIKYTTTILGMFGFVNLAFLLSAIAETRNVPKLIRNCFDYLYEDQLPQTPRSMSLCFMMKGKVTIDTVYGEAGRFDATWYLVGGELHFPPSKANGWQGGKCKISNSHSADAISLNCENRSLGFTGTWIKRKAPR